jgi:F0F1-type ATP synthase delta subunit
MKSIQLTNNPPIPDFKGISVALLANERIQMQFYQLTGEDEETIYAEVTSSIRMTKDQWENVKQIVDSEFEDPAQPLS